jgi:eukaryotic-like serine/threonine-protein kinase
LESHSLSAEEVAHFTRQIAQGMAAAHSAGVVHGDLKPGNLMVTPDAQIKIMDFGLARRILPTRWQAETLDVDHLSGSGLFGTPSYMAPELARGEFSTPASDVFTLGLILCEMLTGTPVISGDSLLAILRDVDQFEIPPYVATFPQPFGRICQECLAADPAARQITMAQIADMLA